MHQTWHEWIRNFGEIFYPQLCIPCGRKLFSGEKYICLFCLQELPKTGFHTDKENKVAQLFWGRTEVARATSWLYFRKGSAYQQLIHHLKYKGLKELGSELGYLFAMDLAESEFRKCDLIMPVPLHPARELKRGYNQSEWIAKGLSSALCIPISCSNLKRSKYNPTQTRKSRFERWQNVEGIFGVADPMEIMHKKVLLVDDVITTGATLEAAVIALLQTGVLEVSVATLALAEI